MTYFETEPPYFEPTRCALIMDKFVNEMADALTAEALDKIEADARQNEKLTTKINHMAIKIRTLENQVAEYKRREHEVEKMVRKDTAAQLLAEFQIVAFKAVRERVVGPKCDRCDDGRIIRYKSPMGRNLTENCLCANGDYIYQPRTVWAYSFAVERQKVKNVWYRLESDTGNHLQMDTSSLRKIMADNVEDFSTLDLSYNNVFFEDADRCQEYCDWLNGDKDGIQTE